MPKKHCESPITRPPRNERADRLKIDVREWLAGTWDREQFSEHGKANVNVNLLHLEALKHANARRQQ